MKLNNDERKYSLKTVMGDRRAVAKVMKPNRKYTVGDMVTLTGIHERRASLALRALHDMGLIKREKLDNLWVYWNERTVDATKRK